MSSVEPDKSSPCILIVDADCQNADKLCQLLCQEGYQAHSANSVETASQRLQDQLYDVVLADPKLRDQHRTDASMLCAEVDPSLPVLNLVPWAILQPQSQGAACNMRNAVAKPVRRDDLLAAIERVLDSSRLRLEASTLRRRLGIEPSFNALLGQSPLLLEQIARARQLARSDIPVLIRGESGTGKELMAAAIHASSLRAGQPWVTAFLSGEPRDLHLSALFGHLRGAFTGAVTARRGWFREAHLGTLFIDEVGDLVTETQGALLRVLDKSHFKVIGEDVERLVDVRIISATNRDLPEDVREGRFRLDLYQRLGGDAIIELPPLRERTEDIPLLLDHFSKQYSGPNCQPPEFDAATLDALMNYPWPGNVRELQHKTRFALLVANGETISPEHFQLPSGASSASARFSTWFNLPLKEAEAAFSLEYVQRLLEKCGGDKNKAAELAGTNVSTIRRRLKASCLDGREVPDVDA